MKQLTKHEQKNKLNWSTSSQFHLQVDDLSQKEQFAHQWNTGKQRQRPRPKLWG